jgi:hypothetical protein
LARLINPFNAGWFLQCRKRGKNARKNRRIAAFSPDFDEKRFAVARMGG